MYIGIDVGTTSTAAIIYDSKTSKPVCIKSEIHNAGSIQPNGHHRPVHGMLPESSS